MKDNYLRAEDIQIFMNRLKIFATFTKENIFIVTASALFAVSPEADYSKAIFIFYVSERVLPGVL